MSEQLQIAIYQMVAKVGIETAISVFDKVHNAKTIDEAISALKAAQATGWKEAKTEPI